MQTNNPLEREKKNILVGETLKIKCKDVLPRTISSNLLNGYDTTNVITIKNLVKTIVREPTLRPCREHIA